MVEEHAYRFVPCGLDGAPRENSELALLTSARLLVGSVVELELDGFSRWEVVDLKADPRPLVGVTDSAGNHLALAGTILCRGVQD
jgi:hypothetical protein